MGIEIASASDNVSGNMIMNSKPTEQASAKGVYSLKCFDKDGNLKWEDTVPNLVVEVGLQYMTGAALYGTTPITSWFLGLYGPGASNTPAGSDTLAIHPGWTEITPYGGVRPTCVFAAPSSANPSVITNSASPAAFNINATATVGGAFLCSANSGTSGTLFSASDFTGGDRNVVSGDTLQVTYTFSLTGT
jgi:hypothetical protein